MSKLLSHQLAVFIVKCSSKYRSTVGLNQSREKGAYIVSVVIAQWTHTLGSYRQGTSEKTTGRRREKRREVYVCIIHVNLISFKSKTPSSLCLKRNVFLHLETDQTLMLHILILHLLYPRFLFVPLCRIDHVIQLKMTIEH